MSQTTDRIVTAVAEELADPSFIEEYDTGAAAPSSTGTAACATDHTIQFR